MSRPVRALRGSGAAAIATVLASTGHTIGGGTAPALWLIVAVTLLAAPLAVALVGRRRNLPRLAAAVAAAQIALHTAFAVVGDATPAASAHGHMSMVAPTMAGPLPAVGHLSADMLAGHLVAALITIAAVAYGEQMVAMIARGIRRVLARVQQSAPAEHPVPPAFADDVRPDPSAPLLTALTRRGPPAFAR